MNEELIRANQKALEELDEIRKETATLQKSSANILNKKKLSKKELDEVMQNV